MKPLHYLVKHEEISYTQKDDCHPKLADFEDDNFSIRIKYEGEGNHNTFLNSFPFRSIVPIETKYKKLTKNQVR